MESVPVGKSRPFPVTTAGASAAQRGKSEAAADAVWTIGVTELTPKRNAVRLIFGIEDAARIPGLESALTRDLRMALTEGVDRAIFLGDAGANRCRRGYRRTPDRRRFGGPKEITQANKVKGSETLEAFAEHARRQGTR